jgi:adenine phosphoribosyltransferase
MPQRQSTTAEGPDLYRFIRDVPDFPKPGILFRDVTPLLADPRAFRAAVEALAAPFRDDGVDRVLGIESRGFILGAPVALALGAGLVIVRKAGKLPWRTVSASYDLEYGTDTVEMHVDAVEPGQRVIVVDDLIATGGTAAAAVRLAHEAKADLVGCTFLIELKALRGRERLGVERTHVVLEY